MSKIRRFSLCKDWENLCFVIKRPLFCFGLPLLLFLVSYASKLPSVLSGNGFEFNGEYNQTRQILDDDFHQPKSVIIVLFEKEKKVHKQEWENFIKDSLNKAKKVPAVEGVISPFEQPGNVQRK